MFPFIAAFCASIPRLSGSRSLALASVAAGHVLRIAVATAIALATYAAALTAFTRLCPNDRPEAPVVYAAGLAIATLLSICVLALAAPRRLAAQVLPWASAAAVLLPVAMFDDAFAGGQFQSTYLGYLAAVCAGGVGGIRMTLWAFARI